MNAFDIEIGTKVKWNHLAIANFKEGKERELQKSRIFEVVDIIDDETVQIADEYGEGEVFIDELDIIE
jgi:hypothetical protein